MTIQFARMTEFRDLLDLASERLGGSVLFANDDFFAEKENLLKPLPAVWKEHEYTDRGKWMDGWESRRKRVPGHDYAIIRLGLRGVVRGFVVDTAFFRGNYPESCSIEGTSVRSDAPLEQVANAHWHEVLPRTPLQGNSENVFASVSDRAWSHLRFNIFPDGGVARLRVHGEVVPDWHLAGGLGGEIDLAAAENGAEVLQCSDMFFGPKHNLIMPGRAHNMSDGWETKRRRGPGHDWVVVRMATEGRVRRVEIDTNHFKGNYPDTASLEGSRDGETWMDLIPRTKLQAHTRHYFLDELANDGPFTHLRLNVYPDGGVSRLRVWGKATEDGRHREVVRRLNSLTEEARTAELLRCNASTLWASTVAAAAPYGNWNELLGLADRVWREVGPDDWREAFAAHPRIGERKATSRWSSQEQSGTNAASSETMNALADANRQYEEKFGQVFLICAAGRGAEEMLAACRERLGNDAETELRNAAEEQRKITHLRLEKLVL